MNAEPIIFTNDSGRHNADLSQTVNRLSSEHSWKDLSTIAIVPAVNLKEPEKPAMIPFRVAVSWMGMINPPNNRFIRLGAQGLEVGDAYSRCIEGILANPDLSTWKYILTIEHDNAPPSDGMVQLARRMEEHPGLAAIGGLYFTKGPGGCAQIWGDPNSHPLNFRPQLPDPNGGLVLCNGLGMGFTLFRLEMFKDARLRRPWFKTPASATEGAWTQDLYGWSDFYKHGYKCAVDCSVKVGHYSSETDTMW
jgi:hypothetical protein